MNKDKRKVLNSKNLENANLSEMNFKNKDLSNRNLKKANLIASNLIKSNLENTDLSYADLTMADLKGACLDKAIFMHSILINADLRNSSLMDCNSKEANFTGANLSSANLSNANVTNADFSGADLSGAILRKADVSSANFTGANLSSANLSNANVTNADFSGADLSGAILKEADLSGVNLSGANLSTADLSKANLNNVDLSGADLSDSNLKKVDFRSAKIKGAKFFYAKGLSKEQVNYIKVTGGVIYSPFRKKLNEIFNVIANNKSIQITLLLTSILIISISSIYFSNPLHKSYNSLERLANKYSNRGNFEKAIQLYQILVERNAYKAPENLNPQFQIVFVYRRMREFDKALTMLVNLSKSPQLSVDNMNQLYQNIAQTYQEMGKPEEAKSAYKIILDKYPSSNPEINYQVKMAIVTLQRQQGQRLEAIKAYEGLLTQYQNSIDKAADIYANIAQIYVELGKPEEAKTAFQVLLDKYSADNPERTYWVKMNIINLQRQQDQRLEAIKAYEGLLKQYHNSADKATDIYTNIAQTYVELGKPEEAKTAFGIILDKYSTNNPERTYWAAMNIVGIQRQQGQREGAIKAYQRLLSQYQNSPNKLSEIYQNIAQTYVELGKPEEAKSTLQIILDKYPSSNPEINYQVKMAIVILQRQQGQRVEAIKAYERLLKQYQNSADKVADIYANIAQTYVELGKPEEAKTAFGIILDKYSTNNPERTYWVKMSIVGIQRGQGQREEAIKVYQGLLSQYQNSPNKLSEIYQNIAQTYVELGKPEEAKSTLQIILDKYPSSNPEINYQVKMAIVTLQRQQGQRLEAIKAYEGLLTQYQNYADKAADIYANIAQTYVELGKPEEAKTAFGIILDKYSANNPDRAYWSKMSIIGIQRQQGQREEAIKAYQGLLSQYKNSPNKVSDIYQNIAQTYQELGKPDEAKRILEEIKTGNK